MRDIQGYNNDAIKAIIFEDWDGSINMWIRCHAINVDISKSNAQSRFNLLKDIFLTNSFTETSSG